MTNLEIFYAKAQNSGNLPHLHGTSTLILSWMHVKRMPGNGPRKRMSNSTLCLNGLSRSVKWWNADSDDWNILSTPDPSPFFVTLMLSVSFPVSMRILLKFLQTKHPITIPLFARDTMSTSWSRNLDSIHFLETLHTIWPIFLHQRCKSVLTSFGIQSNSEELDSTYIYWIPKMQKKII